MRKANSDRARLAAALIPWLFLVGAHAPKDHAQKQGESRDERIGPALKDIAALKKSQELSQLQEPCKGTADDRASELCAQWSATDAGLSSANAAWLFGALGTLIGGLTLAAAWNAAKWARRAAEETKRAADLAEASIAESGQALAIAERNAQAATEQVNIAKETARHELRAYLSVQSVAVDESEYDEDRLQIILQVENSGQTPARLKDFVLKADWVGEGNSTNLLHHRSKNSVTIHRNTPVHLPLNFPRDFEHADEPGHIVVVGHLAFEDIFGELQKEAFAFQSQRDAFLCLHEHEFPFNLAAFSVAAIIEQFEALESKLKNKPVHSDTPA